MPKIKLSKKARKYITKLDSNASNKILKHLKNLSRNNENLDIKKLNPKNLNLYRSRISNHRIVFKYKNQDIHIMDIGKRDSIYQ